MTRLVLAVDAGGTHTRAVVLERDGTCRGYGRAAAGNPTSSGVEVALASVGAAAAQALARAGREPDEVDAVYVAMAGSRSTFVGPALVGALSFAGDPGRVHTESDILAMYRSGAWEADGAAVVAGTGSVAARIRDGVVERVWGGAGWLLGDGGSGFALGHAVARAVAAELDGTGEPTALTPALLEAYGLPPEERSMVGLVDAVHRELPVRLARHAGLVLRVGDDPVAAALLAAAQDELADLICAVRRGSDDGPLVVGGGVAGHVLLAPDVAVGPALQSALAGAELRRARDGAVGAAAAAWAAEEQVAELPSEVFERIRSTVEKEAQRDDD